MNKGVQRTLHAILKLGVEDWYVQAKHRQPSAKLEITEHPNASLNLCHIALAKVREFADLLLGETGSLAPLSQDLCHDLILFAVG